MSVRLRHVAAVNPTTPEFDALADDAEMPFLPLEAVWPGARLDLTRRRPKSEVATGYTRFREGDILVPKITPTFQADRTVIAQGVEGGVGAGTTELHVVRAGGRVEARYLRYLLSSKPFLDEGEAAMVGVAGQKRVPDDCLSNLAIPVVDPGSQRAIADYLDVETARIDALIEKKRRMVELLEERLRAEVDHLTRSEEQPEVPLRRFVAEACDGPFGSALKTEHYADWGARVIRLGNIGVATWRDDDVAFIPIPYWMNLGRHHASTGDLVIAGLGDEGNPVGRACVLPDLGPALVKADCYRLRIRPEVGDSTYLAWHLSSPRALANAARVAEGSTRARLTLGKALSLPVPLLAVERQRAIASCLVNGAAAVERLNGQVRRELSLLTERRQALITAAVTGELAIPGVAA